VPGVPLVGPDGVEGVLTVSGEVMLTVSVPDHGLTTDVLETERA
jgi:hypothetical protein